MGKIWIRFSAVFGFLAVAMGAAGAHVLQNTLSAVDIERIETAVRYQMWHALALIAVAWLASQQTQNPSMATTVAGWFFVAGIIVFCGSLYGLSLTELPGLAYLAPVGGLLLMAGWLAVLASTYRVSASHLHAQGE